jgi:hypothetical protein
VIIKPASGALNIFIFDSLAMNCGIENIYIDGDYNGYGSNLNAAIFFRGKFNLLYNNNVVNCKIHAIYSDADSCRIEKNNFQGLADLTITFPSFLGALHINSMGDSYLIDNEIGANSNHNTLRNSNRRAVALYANTFSTSVISGNIFENGDRACFLQNSIYNYFAGNRYEYNTGGGIELDNVAESVFVGERFTNNSMALDGGYVDLVINSNCGSLRFISPTFCNIGVPAGMPNPDRRSKFNISNFRTDGEFATKIITPYFRNAVPPKTDEPTVKIDNIPPAVAPRILDI